MNSSEFLRILGIDVDQNEVLEVPRAKKRRLDHLTWDEKIQRKKLKNRVAAQTSRDRKKARIEQMESAITELCTRNDTLLSECENLKTLNEQLSKENAELKARLSEPCLSCKEKRSVGPESDEGSSESLLLPMGPSVPSLPDLLDDLHNDIDFESLEQLAESLLEDIARDLENAAQKADCEVQSIDESGGQGTTRPVVGEASKKLESTRSSVLNTEKEKSLENDISQYLLLHHNYTKPGPDPRELPKPKNKCKKDTKSKTVLRTNSKLKKIIPKIPFNILTPKGLHFQDESVQNLIKCEPAIECSKPIISLDSILKEKTSDLKDVKIPKIIKCEPVLECNPSVNLDTNLENLDVIYGTYDEATNCVTIVINEDGTNAIDSEEIVLSPENTVSSDDVQKSSNTLSLPFSKIVNGSVSPISSSGSDCGYESLGSPSSHCENEWAEMSELFPTLL